MQNGSSLEQVNTQFSHNPEDEETAISTAQGKNKMLGDIFTAESETPIKPALKVPRLSQTEFKTNLMDKIFDTAPIEKQFSQVHQLIDQLFKNEEDLEQ